MQTAAVNDVGYFLLIPELPRINRGNLKLGVQVLRDNCNSWCHYEVINKPRSKVKVLRSNIKFIKRHKASLNGLLKL